MRDCVIDLSHHNGMVLDFNKAKADGIEAVFHKATQGTRYSDPRFLSNRDAILQAGLLCGAYHFGTGSSSGQEQAAYFLKSVPQGTLLALDFEPNPQGATMSIQQAKDFCAVIESTIPRSIVVYTGAPMLPSCLQLKNGLYGERPLWWAQYSKAPSRAPKDWKLSLWQYTDHGHVEGIGFCDRNEFFGDDLHVFWSQFQGVEGELKGE